MYPQKLGLRKTRFFFNSITNNESVTVTTNQTSDMPLTTKQYIDIQLDQTSIVRQHLDDKIDQKSDLHSVLFNTIDGS